MMQRRTAAVVRVADAIVWAGRFVKGWMPRTLGGLASLAFIVWGALGGGAWTSGIPLLVAGIVLAFLAFITEVLVQQPSYMQLAKLRESAEIKADQKSEALERAIRILLIRLGIHCSIDGHNDRISVYYFHDGEFVGIARHAKNPTFGAPGRRQYAATEGAIGQTWTSPHGQALVKMPTGNESWRKSAKKQGISDSDIDGMKMRSAVLAGYRLEGSSQSVGVLMLESTMPHRLNQTHLDQVAASHIVAAIGELVAAFATLTPAVESMIGPVAKPAPGRWKAVLPRVPYAVGPQK